MNHKPLHANLEITKKMAQMVMIGFLENTLKSDSYLLRQIQEDHLGGAILYGRNVVSPTQLKHLTSTIKAAIPSDSTCLISIDQEGGQVSRLNEKTGYAATIPPAELGAHSTSENTEKQAETIATWLQGLDIDLNFSPVVDLICSPGNFIASKGRSFSNDPAMVALHAKATIQKHREKGVLTSLKHFPGHGSARADSHLGFVDVTQTWSERELIPYQELIDNGLVDMIMTAHVYNANLDPDYPATLSKKTIQGILRKKFGFQGVVVSDDLDMKAISDNFKMDKALGLAINGGVDLLLFSNHQGDKELLPKILTSLHRLLDKGIISEAQIDASCERIWKLREKEEV